VTAPALDLARIRAAHARLDALALAHPDLTHPGRAEALALDLETLTMPTDDNRRAPVKLPPDLLDRAEALVPLVLADPELSATMGRVSRAGVIRVALLKGLTEMEKQAAKRGKGA